MQITRPPAAGALSCTVTLSQGQCLKPRVWGMERVEGQKPYMVGYLHFCDVFLPKRSSSSLKHFPFLLLDTGDHPSIPPIHPTPISSVTITFQALCLVSSWETIFKRPSLSKVPKYSKPKTSRCVLFNHIITPDMKNKTSF